ncbi:glycosyltransferase family 2 protein [Diaphorobacter sp. HDW4B]|nr:glycosyltransferase family 2 protein [Diaphorobacter sp. HDW4B]
MAVAHAAAVLIINFNTAQRTIRCIESIRRGSMLPRRIWILDNDSQQEDFELLQTHVGALTLDGVELILLRSERNLGFAAGCNLMIDRALEDVECTQLLLLNSDAVALPEWVRTMTTCASRTPESTGMVGARMHKLARPQEVDTLGISLYRSLMPADRHCLDDLLVGPSGGCCLLKRAMLEDIHRVAGYYFDARYFCYCEDTDLVLRAVLGGYQTIYVNEVLALHEGQASSGGGVSSFITYHGLRNSIWMHAKLLPASIFWRFGLLLVLAHMLSIARHGLFGRVGLLWRTYKDALAGLPSFWRERARFQQAFRSQDAVWRSHITPAFYRRRYLSHVLRMEGRKHKQSRRAAEIE